MEHSILAIQEVLSGESRALESSREKELVQNLSPVGSGSFPSNLTKLEQLTPQKKAILAHVAQGKTNKEIAELLNISDKTVRNHLTAIFRKLRITRRPEAVSLFIRANFENVDQNQ
jgi:DNA-binding NarL/FixJ family response regulator